VAMKMAAERYFEISVEFACRVLVSCLAYFSTQKMEAACSSETSVDFHRTRRRYVPEDRALHVDSSLVYLGAY
jgi:hypothetical protein